MINKKITGGGHKGSCQSSRFTRRFGRVLNSFNLSKNKIKAFTLAETLVTLTIIGIVAALTIPTVIQNYQRKIYVTQLKKSYNNITNGFRTYMATNGVTKLSDTPLFTSISTLEIDIRGLDMNGENKNETFRNEFFKVFNVASVHGSSSKLSESQRVYYKPLSASEVGELDEGIFLADGSLIIYFVFTSDFDYHRADCGEKKCSSLKEFQDVNNTQSKFWEAVGNIIIDVNGLKGPNTYGRDVFVFAISNDGTLYPYGATNIGEANWTYYWENPNDCNTNGDGIGCAGRIMEENWQMNY